MATQQTTPLMGAFDSFDSFEDSPADSFISTPGGDYSSLFPGADQATPGESTVNPMDMMTPQSDRHMSAIPEEDDMDDSTAKSSGTPDKKTGKKRKSWGQVLPEPKTNLPPRKRAKTEDEKEQRRVERVLRNRRAAQSSRERKRLEVEALEQRNQDLEAALLKAQQANMMLAQELSRLRGNSDASPLAPLHNNPLTLSKELFSSQDGHSAEQEAGNTLINDLLDTTNTTTTDQTVDPASLSPSLGPVDQEIPEDKVETLAAQSSVFPTASSDVTQHPAAMLSDLQCHTSEVALATLEPKQRASPLALFLQMTLLSASALATLCQRPLMQIAMSLKAGSSILPTPQLLMTIIWLVTMTPSSSSRASRASTTSSPRTTTKTTLTRPTFWQRVSTPLRRLASTSRPTTLRLKLLKKILSSSPNLARPLTDATMEVLRLFSEQRDDRVMALWRETSATRGFSLEQPSQRSDGHGGLPSREVLLTLLWTLRVEMKRMEGRLDDKKQSFDTESGVPETTTNNPSLLRRESIVEENQPARDLAV
jgi:transcriptional activator HAC1